MRVDRVQIDGFVNDPVFRPEHGWYSDFHPQDNNPCAIQQARDEFCDFLDVCLDAGASRVFQIGLGLTGASHYVFTKVFAEAWCIDNDLSRINRYQNYRQDNRRIPGVDRLIFADTRDHNVMDVVREKVPAVDMLFIDGSHDFGSVQNDYNVFASLVRSGGVIAFHDSVSPAPGVDVSRFIKSLEIQGTKFYPPIGDLLGISYFLKGG